MKRSKERAVGLADIDPQLAELAREKEAQVRQAVMLAGSGGGVAGASAAATRAAAAQQASTMEGQAAIEILRANERAEEAIRGEIRGRQRGLKKAFSGPGGLVLRMILIPMIMIPLLMVQILSHRSGDHQSLNFLPFIAPLMMIPIFATMGFQYRKRKTLSPTVLRAVLPAVARTPGEQAYAEAAAEVCDASLGTLDTTQAREMMQSLNSLLESERTLDAQRESIDRATNAQSLADAEAERDRLEERLRATNDDAARETLRQSLELCEGRLEQTQRLAPARERIDAQQEAIHQVMASVRSSLAGLGIMTATGSEFAAAPAATAPQTAALRETTTQLQNRARAVEQAVQEVAALRVRA